MSLDRILVTECARKMHLLLPQQLLTGKYRSSDVDSYPEPPRYAEFRMLQKRTHLHNRVVSVLPPGYQTKAGPKVMGTKHNSSAISLPPIQLPANALRKRQVDDNSKSENGASLGVPQEPHKQAKGDRSKSFL